LGYLTAEQLEKQANSMERGAKVADHYIKFKDTSKRAFQPITPDTPLEELEKFFAAGQEFAVITDETCKFVLGVATRDDLEKFVKHRPSLSA
jgi:hypothetical protein